jgi:hypothetical protein
LGKEAVGFFEFTPEEEGFLRGGGLGGHFGRLCEGSLGVRVCGIERSCVVLLPLFTSRRACMCDDCMCR